MEKTRQNISRHDHIGQEKKRRERERSWNQSTWSAIGQRLGGRGHHTSSPFCSTNWLTADDVWVGHLHTFYTLQDIFPFIPHNNNKEENAAELYNPQTEQV
mmetsp:Transcript_21343/g.62178  ORF Transcript_21343/g.62178 Transcript_21343/m.62178 type:complete len:101 (+) Transcript_21343:1022-1324(+)